jgi:hypothetical protein
LPSGAVTTTFHSPARKSSQSSCNSAAREEEFCKMAAEIRANKQISQFIKSLLC